MRMTNNASDRRRPPRRPRDTPAMFVRRGKVSRAKIHPRPPRLELRSEPAIYECVTAAVTSIQIAKHPISEDLFFSTSIRIAKHFFGEDISAIDGAMSEHICI